MKCEPCTATLGLTATEAARLLQQYGPNAAAEERRHVGRALLSKLWVLVPWMLEVTIGLQVLLIGVLEHLPDRN